MTRDIMAGKRFDGTDRPEDEKYSYGGPCWCGVAEGVHHTHADVLKTMSPAPSPPTQAQYDALMQELQEVKLQLRAMTLDRDTLQTVAYALEGARDQLAAELKARSVQTPRTTSKLRLSCEATETRNNVVLTCFRPPDHSSDHYDRREDIWWGEFVVSEEED